jgi:hypothetical protein
VVSEFVVISGKLFREHWSTFSLTFTSGEVVRFTYEEFKNLHGQSIFGFHEPKKIIDSIIDDLPNDYGIKIETGIQVKHNGGHGRGFSIMRFSKDTEE